MSDLTKELVLASFCQTCDSLPQQAAAEKAQEYVVKIQSQGGISSQAFQQQVFRLALKSEAQQKRLLEKLLKQYFLCIFLHKSALLENLKTKPAEVQNDQLARVPLHLLCKTLGEISSDSTLIGQAIQAHSHIAKDELGKLHVTPNTEFLEQVI